jgi:multiple RNA-binding domain-containing protein 1
MSSRIIVKNIPKEITEKELQVHFSKKGVTTDVKIMKKENGQSRKFSFIGFKNDSEANETVKYFNNTFLWTCKIIVESAKAQNDPALNKTFNNKSLNNKNNNIKSDKKNKNSPGDELDEKAKAANENSKENKIKKIMELAAQISTKSKFDAINLQMQKDVENVNTQNKSSGDTEFNNTNTNENKKDNNDINSKDSENLDKKTTISNKENQTLPKGEAKKYTLETINLDPRRLYLKNIPFEIIEDEVRALFQTFGEITEIHIPKNYKTNQSFGYAYISFATVESSALALGELDKTFFQGRKLHISIAEKKQEKEQNNLNDPRNINPSGKSDYKTEKKLRMQGAFSNETNWNYLFMNQNAVVEAVARKLNISKAELMSKENANLAVQQAAMETSIINETKEWLNQNGFNLDALKGKRSECARSANTIFIKNISITISAEKLETYFARYGQLVRFLISPSNTLAIAEFVDAKHAINCIRKLAYFDIDGLPLYLEYAPEGIIEKANNKKTDDKTADKKTENKTEKNKKAKEESDLTEEIRTKNNKNTTNDEDNNINEGEENIAKNHIDLVGNEGKILFITNLNFNTKENALKKFFTERGFEPKKVKIVTHSKEGKDKPVSSGFGFLEFESEEAPQKILRTFQGALLHGHSLKLCLAKSSEKKKNESLLGQKRKAETELNDYDYEGEDVEATKLLIKNLAFEADKDELKKLFGPFGEIKSLRVPKKLDGSHRGFAFIEFISHEESKKAFKALLNTHFYGRKLVIEWANKEKNVEDMRADVERKLKASQVVTHRTQKRAIMEISDFK